MTLAERARLRILPKPLAISRWREFTEALPDGIAGYDVESTAITDMGVFDPAMRLRTVQFGSRTEAWVLDAHDPFWRPHIEALLRREDRRFVSHTSYDVLWALREFGIELGERSIDTLPMASLLYPSDIGGNDLKTLCTDLIDAGLSEAETALHARIRELAPVHHRVGKKMTGWGFSNIPLDDPAFGRYAGLDAVYVRVLLDLLGTELRRTHAAKLSRREQIIARQATAMQWRGQLLDLERTHEVLHEIDSAWTAHETWLRDRLGFSPRSPKLGPWLAEHGATFTEMTETGLPSLTKDTLPGLVKRYAAHPVLGPVLAHKAELNSRSNLRTNLQSILAHADAEGAVHPRINTQGAVTGRISIVNPALQTFKKNDKRLRGCFVARPGFVLVTADYHQQEVRLAYAFSRDKALGKIIREGLNQHLVTAGSVFAGRFMGKEETPELYDAAKILDFMLQYGGGPRRLGDSLGLPRSKEKDALGNPYANPKAQEMWRAWRETYAGLVAWTDKMAELPIVVNPWGRRIPRDRLRGFANGNKMIQSSGRDVLGDAMARLHEIGWDRYLWLTMHDEITLEVPQDEAEDACTALEWSMRTKVKGVPLTATATILGRRWNGED